MQQATAMCCVSGCVLASFLKSIDDGSCPEEEDDGSFPKPTQNPPKTQFWILPNMKMIDPSYKSGDGSFPGGTHAHGGISLTVKVREGEIIIIIIIEGLSLLQSIPPTTNKLKHKSKGGAGLESC